MSNTIVNPFAALPNQLATESIPFNALSNSIAESIPAYEQLVERAQRELARIQSQPGITCREALDVFDTVTRDCAAVVGLVSHLESVCTADAVRAANEKLQELSSRFKAELYSDSKLANFFATLEPLPSERRTLENLLFTFKTSGAQLAPEPRARLIEIEQQLSEVTTHYGQAVVDSTKAWKWYTSDESQIAGVPESDRLAAREAAKAGGKSDGYLFTLQAPSYRAIVGFDQNRSIRETFARAYGRRASEQPHNNSERVAKILALRAEKAALLGYDNFVDLAVSDRMARSAAAVQIFFDAIKAPVAKAAEKDLALLTAFARSEGHPASEPLAAWDVGFYEQRYSEKMLGLDPEVIREYFPFEPSLDSIFSLVESVFGVSFAPVDIPTWWDGVKSFSAKGFGRDFGVLYTDYYARDNKRAGAWMDNLAPAITGRQKAIGLMAGNFSKPTAGRPALLTHDEITTLFHEAGHLLHGLVCETSRALDGMQSVAWDFIEVPSQILENWAWEPAVLKRITKHYITGQPMPDELIAKLVASRSFMNGIHYGRHLGNSSLDLALHTTYNQQRDGEPVAWARNFMKGFVPYTLDDGAFVNSFTHLFGDPEGYAGGYYSYLWSEALEADMYTAFANNPLDRAMGEKFVREVLMPGDMIHASELFANFMGRAPSHAALLKRIGG